ncbi:hypothetical protein VFA_001912 [Vibrio furnissii CIP 102972]|nr:hypothetical protein VFA_001912 [Vibrio furnissii CIP 102972]
MGQLERLYGLNGNKTLSSVSELGSVQFLDQARQKAGEL